MSLAGTPADSVTSVSILVTEVTSAGVVAIRWSLDGATRAKGTVATSVALGSGVTATMAAVTSSRAIRASGALLVLGEDGGCETLVELGVALAYRLPIVWLERAARLLPLSATCASVCTRVRSLDEALALLEECARAAA